MRTTIDIPENLLRQAKAEAALRGMKLKDFVAEALRSSLAGGPGGIRERAPDYGSGEVQRIDDECVFPLIRGPGGTALRDLTSADLHAILEQEDVEGADRDADPR